MFLKCYQNLLCKKCIFFLECADVDKMLFRAKIEGKTMKPEVILLQTREVNNKETH